MNFPKGKPIYTYPTDMTPAGDLQFGPEPEVKEGLVDELKAFVREHDRDPRRPASRRCGAAAACSRS